MKSKFQISVTSSNNPESMRGMLALKYKICQALNADPDGEVTVPATVWEKLGGHPNMRPATVRLHYPEAPNVVTDYAKGRPVQLTHLSHHFLDRHERIASHSSFSYCGLDDVAGKTSIFLEDVTCPECLRWLAKENTNH